MACSLLMAWNRLPCANPLSFARSEKRAAAAVLACQPTFITGPSRVPFLFLFFRCALKLNQTSPSSTFVIRHPRG